MLLTCMNSLPSEHYDHFTSHGISSWTKYFCRNIAEGKKDNNLSFTKVDDYSEHPGNDQPGNCNTQ